MGIFIKNNAKKNATGYVGQFLLVLRKAHIPLLWTAVSFAFNLAGNTMLLKLPTMTASLMAGDLSGKALRDSILFYVLYAVVMCSQTAVQAVARCPAAKNARCCLWGKMLHIRMDYYDKNDPAELMSAVTSDL